MHYALGLDAERQNNYGSEKCKVAGGRRCRQASHKKATRWRSCLPSSLYHFPLFGARCRNFCGRLLGKKPAAALHTTASCRDTQRGRCVCTLGINIRRWQTNVLILKQKCIADNTIYCLSFYTNIYRLICLINNISYYCSFQIRSIKARKVHKNK